jgi:lysophospholipase L1-like esterase
MIKKLIIFCIFISVGLYASAIRIMPFGDSITYDNSYADLENPRPTSMRSAYRNYLWYNLQDGGFNVDFVGTRHAGAGITPHFDVDNEGYPGKSSYYLAEKTYDLMQKNQPDIVLLHAGSNDWGESPRGIEDILDEIDTYEEISGRSVIVILALIINRKEYAHWIRAFNGNVKNMAKHRIDNGDKIIIVDMERGADIDYKVDMRDPAHPTDRGYKKMAKVWYDAIKGISFKEPKPEAFVLQFYHHILGREPHEEPLNRWKEYLQIGSVASAVISFFDSQEYKNREVDNEEFINILYKAILGRDADIEGFEYWVNELDSGIANRDNILEIFLNSSEFLKLCEEYGLIAITQDDKDWFGRELNI